MSSNTHTWFFHCGGVHTQPASRPPNCISCLVIQKGLLLCGWIQNGKLIFLCQSQKNGHKNDNESDAGVK